MFFGLLRVSWYLFPILVYNAVPNLFDGFWAWTRFYTTCWWIGEFTHRVWAGQAIGEFLEQREGVRSKTDQTITNLREDLSSAKRKIGQHRREQEKLDDATYKLNASRSELRKARRYVDVMTDYYGPLPDGMRGQ